MKSSTSNRHRKKREKDVGPCAATATAPAAPGSGLGMGVSLWLHRFVVKARKFPENEKNDEANATSVKSQNPAPPGSEAELVTNARMSLLKGGANKTSWSDLRRSIVRAKISEALMHLKFSVNGQTLTVIKVIGEGGFSKVYEVFDPEKQLFALKVVDFIGVTDALKADLLREIEFLQRFKGHRSVIEMVDFEHYREGDDVNRLHILLERGECALSTVLRSLTHHATLTPSKLRFYWEQMLEALQTIHTEGVVHADVKPANFLLVQGHLKLIDFGFAVQAEPGEEFVIRNYVGGTKDYMSPESLSHYVIEEGSIDLEAMKRNQCPIKVGFKSDIWALGVILYQLVYDGIAPFSSIPGGKAGKLKALISPEVAVEFEPLDDRTLMNTMKICLEKDPTKRADLDTLLKHPFLRPNMCLEGVQLPSLMPKPEKELIEPFEEDVLLLKKLKIKDS